MRTKQEEIALINQKQDEYINELINFIETHKEEEVIPFTSPTGTGKTRMMDKLINSAFGQKYFFIITSLSRGGLYKQIEESLDNHCLHKNYKVYGSSDITATTIFRPEDAWEEILEASNKRPLIWIRDEGHLQTNNWSKLLKDKVEYIINFSATNAVPGIECDFSETCMLRTPQLIQSPEVADALDKLLEIKKLHAGVPHYNPCAIFRCINNPTLHDIIIEECAKRNLSVIDLNEDDEVQLADICKDDNPYDVIINKMKIVEGVDLRRAHVAYLGNVPKNPDTIIQFMGRCRRNALLWRNDIDILDEKNRDLLKATRDCYIYFNVTNQDQQEIVDDLTDRLRTAFRNIRSVIEFKVGTKLSVIDGKTENGVLIYQLDRCTGNFIIEQDEDGYKVANPLSEYYQSEKEFRGNYIPSSGFKVVKPTMFGEQVVGYYDKDNNNFIPLSQYLPYSLISNDYESARMGGEFFEYYSEDKKWGEVRTVTKLITKTSGLTCRFIETKYSREFNQAVKKIKEEKLNYGSNHFEFNTICNRCLGWLVEFYTKYLLFGQDYLSAEICRAQSEAPAALRHSLDTPIIFYACFIKYRDIMKNAFGDKIARFIKGPSIEDYITKSYQVFVSTVINLATKTKAFLDSLSLSFGHNNKLFDENLTIRHLSGKADFVSEDTIVDLKTTSRITPEHVRQVLLYHYLSTKRSDLNIKRVIVYDCVTGRSLEVKIDEKNWTTNYQPDVFEGELDDSHLSKITLQDLHTMMSMQTLPCQPLKDVPSYIFIKDLKELKLPRETPQSKAAKQELIGKLHAPVVANLTSYKDGGRNFLDKCVSQGIALFFQPLVNGLFFAVNHPYGSTTYYSSIWSTYCTFDQPSNCIEILQKLLPGKPLLCEWPLLGFYYSSKWLVRENYARNNFSICLSEDTKYFYTLQGRVLKKNNTLYGTNVFSDMYRTIYFVNNNNLSLKQHCFMIAHGLRKVNRPKTVSVSFKEDANSEYFDMFDLRESRNGLFKTNLNFTPEEIVKQGATWSQW